MKIGDLRVTVPPGWRKYRNTPWVTSMALLAVIAVACTCTQYDPVPDPSATLEFRGARFTILTDALVRMEQSLSTFEDRPTLAFVNRKLPVPKFTVTHPTPSSLAIETDAFLLTYSPSNSTPAHTTCADAQEGFDADCGSPCSTFRSPSAPNGVANMTKDECCAFCESSKDCNVWVHLNKDTKASHCYLLTRAVGTRAASNRTVGGTFGGSFTNTSLSVVIKRMPNKTTWRPGSIPTGNLLGTAYSLDGVTGSVNLQCWQSDARKGCTLAPFSRDGWAVYDDFSNMVVDPATG